MESIWLLFVFGTILCWGAYGPAFHAGQEGFEDADRTAKAMRTLLCVGGAYFVLAVILPLFYLGTKAQFAGFTSKGIVGASLAGILGAGGAICIAWAFKNGGTPLYVMPLVFAGAPVVNAVVALTKGGKWSTVHPVMFLGIVMTGSGAFLILNFLNKPWTWGK